MQCEYLCLYCICIFDVNNLQKSSEADDDEGRKLVMGKGKIPDNKDDKENVDLKKIPGKVSF